MVPRFLSGIAVNVEPRIFQILQPLTGIIDHGWKNPPSKNVKIVIALNSQAKIEYLIHGWIQALLLSSLRNTTEIRRYTDICTQLKYDHRPRTSLGHGFITVCYVVSS
jgi:hypothetical protein